MSVNKGVKCVKEKELYDLAGTCIEAATCIAKAVKKGKNVQSLDVLQTLCKAVRYILKELEMLEYEARVSTLYCKNIIASAEKVVLEKWKNIDRVDFEIIPFCQELQFMMQFELQLISREEIDARREKAIQNIEGDMQKKYRYKVTIVIIAYNKLEYTKAAIESIYKYTDFKKNQVELITINNGSTDGTEAYFASLPNEKKMNLACNILGTEIYSYLIESKYIVSFSNDVVATTNWLDNLLHGMEADERIFYAVPTCNYDAISNNQGIQIDYENSFNGMDKMQAFAAAYNHSNLLKWEEYTTLMPFVHIIKNCDRYVTLVYPMYKQLEFIDDDRSTQYRRHRLKQVLAKDTFLHHFGSITLKEAQNQDFSLENMRQVYYKKWGVDAWESRQFFFGIEEQLPPRTAQVPISVLMLEPRFGSSFLQIKNFYRKQGILIGNSAALLTDARYEADAAGIFDEELVADSYMAGLNQLTTPFDMISAGRFLGDLRQEHIIRFLEKLYSKLAPGGMILLPVINYQSMGVILSLLMAGGIQAYDTDVNEFSGYSLGALQQKLAEHDYLSNFEVSMTRLCEQNQLEMIPTILTLIDMKIQKLSEADKTAFAANLSLQSGFLKIYKEL